MPNRLVCSADSCSHNNGGICQSAKIEIQGIGADQKQDTRCATYSENNIVNNFKNIANTNYTGIVNQDLQNGAPAHPDVVCSAGNCEHNSGGRCCESSLQIYSSREGLTMCNNFED